MLLFCTALLAVLGTPGSPIRPDYRYANPKAVDKWHGKREIKNSNVYGDIYEWCKNGEFLSTDVLVDCADACCMHGTMDGCRHEVWPSDSLVRISLHLRTHVMPTHFSYHFIYYIRCDEHYAKFGNVCTISRGEYAIGPEGPESWPLNRNAHNQTYLKW